MLPLALALTVPKTVYVTVLPTGRFTAVSLMLPLPLAVNPVAPPVLAAVNVAPVRLVDKVSLIVAPVTALGPRFVTTIEYEVAPPAVTVPTPLVFTILRSAVAPVNVFVTVNMLLAAFGSVVGAVAVTVA